MLRKQLDFIIAAGETKRFHTWPVLRTQNIAEHSWQVTMLAYLMYGQDEPGITPVFLMALLAHDAAECVAGDVPSPAKRAMGIREVYNAFEQEALSKVALDFEQFLSDEEKRRLKLVDSMSGALYCIREREMGNKLIGECFVNFASYIQELLPAIEDYDELGVEWEVRNYIHAKWGAANDFR